MPEAIKLLLVDDEEKFLEYTAQFLSQHGIECDTCKGPAECLALLDEKQYDVIVSDIVMPGNSGLGFVKDLSAKAEGVPVVIITAYPSVETAVDAVNLPVFSYLVKPVEPSELLNQIRTAYVRSKLLKLVRVSHDRLKKWQKDVNTIEASLVEARGQGEAVPLETFLGLSFANIISSLSDISHLVDSLISGSKEEHPCALLTCPRLKEQVELIRHAIGVLDKTKRSFKSKELGELRRHMENFLAGGPTAA